MYCKFVREPLTVVRELDFNLLIEDFFFLIALGTTVTESKLIFFINNPLDEERNMEGHELNFVLFFFI